MRLVCALLLVAAPVTIQKSTPEDTHYVAAVLEYNYDSSTDVNLANYLDFIRQAAEQRADIVVFPEMTLTRRTAVAVPVHGLLVDHPIPAISPGLYDNVLVQLSTAARNHQIYVVVNVQEELNCSSSQPGETCPGQEVYRFNTNVVFDRSGAVIDRYRKINLFGEYSRLPSLDDSLGVFDTDFGVRFAHFICFDLMFQVPAVQVVQKLNVTDVVFTTMWFSEMPYLTAVEIQEAYAYAHNINFLASGANNVAVGSAGSGIYSGRAGALISTMPGVNTRKMLVSKVPKLPGNVAGMSYPGHIPNDPKVQDNLQLISDPSLPAHVSRVLQLSEQLQQFELRDGDVTCRFSLQLRDLNTRGDQKAHYHYRAVLHNNVNKYAARTAGVISCAVVACLSDDAKSCALRSSNTSSNYEMTRLVITLNSDRPQYNQTLQCYDSSYHPISFKTDNYPLAPDAFSYRVDELQNRSIYHEQKHHHRQAVTMTLKKPQKDLLTFGIWARIFGRDINERHEMDEKSKVEFEKFENSLL